MQDNHSYAEILTMLQAGVSPEEIAKDFTDTLNAAEAEFRKQNVIAKFDENLAELVDQFNLALQNYNSIYGSEKSCAKFFTADEIKGILNAKIQGKNLAVNLNVKVDPTQPVKIPTQAKKMSLQDFIDGMSEEELAEAWDSALNGLIQLFSK